MSEYQTLQNSKMELLAQIDDLKAEVQLLSSANNVDPEAHSVFVQQRARINALEASNRNLMEDNKELGDRADRQKAVIAQKDKEIAAMESKITNLEMFNGG